MKHHSTQGPAPVPAVRFIHVTVSVPASVAVAVPAAAWACGPAALIAVVTAGATACCAVVLLVRFAIDRDDRFARLAGLWVLAAAGGARGRRPPGPQ